MARIASRLGEAFVEEVALTRGGVLGEWYATVCVIRDTE